LKDQPMNRFDIRPLFAIVALALLTACGGNVSNDQADGGARSAALMVQGPAPVADCEAEGCNRPRIVDGLAEQYRSRAIEQAAVPAEPAPAGQQLPSIVPGQDGAPSAPAPAAAG
jgi:hypothetical protein